ncbi:unnamed protein product, partial [Vitis vinifera]|uniref:Uncharacterized protein n=1 Tax=Vitis vinifera TaxID=29760 RepID=E0CRM8_VITVI
MTLEVAWLYQRVTEGQTWLSPLSRLTHLSSILHGRCLMLFIGDVQQIQYLHNYQLFTFKQSKIPNDI